MTYKTFNKIAKDNTYTISTMRYEGLDDEHGRNLLKVCDVFMVQRENKKN